jgi:2,4-dienoyl-CoA reductase (NADPH2)
VGNFPLLFETIDIGPATAAHRVWLAPMTVAYANPDGSVSTAEIEHYARRARGGAAVVLTEHFVVSERGRQLPRQTVVDSAEKLQGLAALADAVHAEGALAIAQLGHAGRYSGPWEEYDRAPRLAPSAVPFRLVGDRIVTPTEMTPADIAETLDEFEVSARLLSEAGFDGVLLHASQGFLPSQFLSPRMNRRRDRYGGPFDNRVRFVLEAFERIRAGFGSKGVLGIQLLGDEAVDGGWSLFEAVELARLLEQHGAHFILPTVSTFETLRVIASPKDTRRWGHQLAAAIAIQSAVDIPVIANGGLSSAQEMDGLVAHRLVAAVALARPLLANPDWPLQASSGKAVPDACDCDPAICLRTQLTGTVCHSWPARHQAKGYWGREEMEEQDEFSSR